MQPLQPLFDGGLFTYRQQVFIADLAVAAPSTWPPAAAAQDCRSCLRCTSSSVDLAELATWPTSHQQRVADDVSATACLI